MKMALLTALSFCVLVSPASALARPATTAVGPFTVETRLSERGAKLGVDGKISSGVDCQRLLINIQVADAKSGQTAAADATIDRYKDLQTKRISPTITIQRATGQAQWYISNIVLQCINNGVATRYASNP